MKKVLIISIVAVLAGFSAQAQFTHKGIRLGLGTASVADDLLTRTPVMGANLGAYVNYGFENAQSFWADNLYLQFGAQFARRGTKFEQVWENMRSYREGYYHNYYLEIPVTAGWRYELPIAQPGHIANFYFGPCFDLGLFGRSWDRHITPGNPQTTINYDTYVTGDKDSRRSFKAMRRIDASLVMGIGYQHNNITIDLFWEHGFVPLMKESDVLRQLAIDQNGGSTEQTITDGDGNNSTITLSNRNAYTGTNQAFILCIGYQLPWN